VTKGLSIFQLYFDGKRWLDSVDGVGSGDSDESDSGGVAGLTTIHRTLRASAAVAAGLHDVTNTIPNIVIYSGPILIGILLLYGSVFRRPKPPVKWYLRLLVGIGGAYLLYASIHKLLSSK
jgi:hypothetical protein